VIPVRRIIGRVTVIENIAVGAKIRDARRLLRLYGRGRWRKVKGLATVELADGEYARRRFITTRPTGLAEKT
jgi:hypothetical protein